MVFLIYQKKQAIKGGYIMFEQINKELEQLQQGISRYAKIESMLDNLRIQLIEQEDKGRRYEDELKKEQVDVDKISKMSLTTVFYTILGSREEQIEKERQEVLAAQLKYNDIKSQIEDTQFQISKLVEEKKEYVHCESKYHTLFQQKYDMLIQSNNVNIEKILEIEKNISLTKSNIIEIAEAVVAGNRVIDEINNTEESLDSAEGWGLWDMWGGGGLITDMIKHSHIDDARSTASEVQRLLNHFRTELADVKIASQINIDIEGFVKFADFFFDGLIADWVVQSHIKDSLESVNTVKNEVNNVIRKLNHMKDIDNANLDKLESELSNLVEHT